MSVAGLTLHWSFDNSKCERTGTVSFGLPAFRSADGFLVCPGSAECAGFCYARQARYLLPNAVRTREINLAIARADLSLFERLAVLDLERIPNRTIRVHDSGDFFSQAYLDCWCAIARQCPVKRFYSYSKSLHLDWSARPANFRMTQSVGGKWDAQIDRTRSHARVFATHRERRAAGYCDGSHTDRAAIHGETRIGLVYHGSTRLTPRIIRLLEVKDHD